MYIFWQDANHLVTAELIRKVQNVRPERREESEDEAAPLWRSLPSYWSGGGE